MFIVLKDENKSILNINIEDIVEIYVNAQPHYWRICYILNIITKEKHREYFYIKYGNLKEDHDKMKEILRGGIKMKITCIIGNDKGNSWEEELDVESLETAEIDIKNIVGAFNANLRPFESPRKLIEIKKDTLKKNNHKHNLRKVNIVTIMSDSGSGCYDIWECTKCGMKRKSYGVNNPYLSFPPRFTQERIRNE